MELTCTPLLSSGLPLSSPQEDRFLHTLYLAACMFFFSLSHYHTFHSHFTALAIIAENSFWYTLVKYPSNIEQATGHFLKSPVARNVSTQILTVFGNRTSAVQFNSLSEGDEMATFLADLVIHNLLRMSCLHAIGIL
jgi:hypothetical protein